MMRSIAAIVSSPKVNISSSTRDESLSNHDSIFECNPFEKQISNFNAQNDSKFERFHSNINQFKFRYQMRRRFERIRWKHPSGHQFVWVVGKPASDNHRTNPRIRSQKRLNEATRRDKKARVFPSITTIEFKQWSARTNIPPQTVFQHDSRCQSNADRVLTANWGQR